MLSLDRAAYGRLMALLVLSSLALWLLLFHERAKNQDQKRNFDRFVRASTIQMGLRDADESLLDAEVLVGLPALNEAQNVGPVLARMPETIRGRRVRTT